MSVMSLITVPLGALVLFILALVPGGDVYTWTKVIFGVFATAIVFATHIPNIRRLVRGTEPKIGEGGERRPPAVGQKAT
jgi:glycerol-3-phosphate acyltransferase PlsY